MLQLSLLYQGGMQTLNFSFKMDSKLSVAFLKSALFGGNSQYITLTKCINFILIPPCFKFNYSSGGGGGGGLLTECFSPLLCVCAYIEICMCTYTLSLSLSLSLWTFFVLLSSAAAAQPPLLKSWSLFSFPSLPASFL